MTETHAPKSKAQTRARILAAAGKLIDQYGPLKTTVADVAREANMSPANIYNFFASRDEILEAVGELHMAEIRHVLALGVHRADKAWDGIRLLFVETARNARTHLANEKDILRLESLRGRDGWQFIKRHHDFLHERLASLLKAGMASGEFAALDLAATETALFDCMIAAIDPVLIMRADALQHERRITAQLDLLRRALR